MSLTNAMNSATSGLLAQSKALASISSNIANSSTTGFKSTSTSFESFLNRKNLIDEDTGGVRAYNYRNITAQGDIEMTETSTNLAVDGSGFFVVSDETSEGDTYYTRDGSFSQDDEGYLVNSDGYYLKGWALNSSGEVSAKNANSTDSLTSINLANIKGTPKATSLMSVAANLPSDAADPVTDATTGVTTYATVTNDMEVFDSLGNSSSLTLTWTKTGSNTWEVSASSPVSSSDSKTTTGTVSGFPMTLNFDSDGVLDTIQDSTGATIADADETTNTYLSTTDPAFSITWSNGATASTVSLNFGTCGKTDGVTQYTSGEDTPDISVESTDQNGYKPGTLTGATIDKDGTVKATFSNGETRAVYKIPIATFANDNGLNSASGSVFTETNDSGSYQLKTASSGNAGAITSGALESSTVELTDEFSRMIMTQQAYTAASKVVTTTDEMLDTLMSLKR